MSPQFADGSQILKETIASKMRNKQLQARSEPTTASKSRKFPYLWMVGKNALLSRSASVLLRSQATPVIKRERNVLDVVNRNVSFRALSVA
jgi:hypothetical protein